MNFKQWLNETTFGQLAKGEYDNAYEKGVRDAQDGNYNPPFVRTQMAAIRKTEYLNGWRAMGQRIPDEKDRKWYQGRLRMRQYAKANPDTRTVDFRVLDDPQWDDPDYDPNVG